MQREFQKGFTLIELIIVIVILGILSVVAAPKFIDFRTDGISAQLNALQGSLKAANTLIYSKSIFAGQEKQTSGSVSVNGQTINTTLGNITPLSANVMKALDGSYEVMANANDAITADWGMYDVPGGTTIYIVPKGYAAFDSCNVLYNVDPSFSSEPTFFSVTTTGC